MSYFDPEHALQRLDQVAANFLEAGCIELRNEAKEVVSVPAPRRLVTSGPRAKVPGVRYYVATTPALKGAPPRKLSGTGRARITSEVDREELVGRVGLNLVYMAKHEKPKGGGAGLHPWLSVAAVNIAPKLGGLVAGSVERG